VEGLSVFVMYGRLSSDSTASIARRSGAYLLVPVILYLRERGEEYFTYAAARSIPFR
jgi:hypothetical protein